MILLTLLLVGCEPLEQSAVEKVKADEIVCSLKGSAFRTTTVFTTAIVSADFDLRREPQSDHLCAKLK